MPTACVSTRCLAEGAARSPAHRVTAAMPWMVGALALGLLETWFTAPVAALPWMRLGLANVAIVGALAVGGRRLATGVAASKVLLVALATGGLGGAGFAMSAAGTAAGVVAMSAASRHGAFSMVGWSVAGATAHMGAQFLVGAAIVGDSAVLALMPASLLAALAFGVVTGLLARTVVSRLPLHGPRDGGRGGDDATNPW